MGPGGLSTVWTYPRPSSGFDLAPMLYSPAGPAESTSGTSFLGMLNMDRTAGGVVMAPKVESPGWDSPSAFRDSMGNRISLDSGICLVKYSLLYSVPYSVFLHTFSHFPVLQFPRPILFCIGLSLSNVVCVQFLS